MTIDDKTLNEIRSWKTGFDELMRFVCERWMYADCGYWKKRGNKYWLSTGGWSDNESILLALQENYFFWSTCWLQSKRGGHYVFKIPASCLTVNPKLRKK